MVTGIDLDPRRSLLLKDSRLGDGVDWYPPRHSLLPKKSVSEIFSR